MGNIQGINFENLRLMFVFVPELGVAKVTYKDQK